MGEFKRLKKEINNIALLISIVAILSGIICISVNNNRGYTENVDIDIKYYDYKKADNEFIKLNSIIPFNRALTNLNWLDEDLLVSYLKDNNYELSLIDIENNKENVIISKYKESIFYGELYISPTKENIIYGRNTGKVSKWNSPEIEYYNYNTKDNSVNRIGSNFRVLEWMYDSSGFVGVEGNEIFSYDLDDREHKTLYKLTGREYLNSVKFSSDGNSLYMLISQDSTQNFLNKIEKYELKSNQVETIFKSQFIDSFELINDENILIQGYIGDISELFVYNIKNQELRSLGITNLYQVYLSPDKTKLITLHFNEKHENTIEIYDINSKEEIIEASYLGKISLLKGIIHLSINSENQLACVGRGNSDNETVIYTYNILSKN